MNSKEREIRIVSRTIQRCARCGWCHSPVVLAYSHRKRSAGFYCLECFELESERSAFDAACEVVS